jgi:peptidoglycan-associated lipoprotein
MKKIAVLLASLLIVACSSTQKTDSSQTSQASATNTTTASNPVTAAVSETEVAARKLSAELSVYFDFDKYAVKPEFQDAIYKQANFIMVHENDVVTLEGNADERGSSEYNLALGHKRAMAVEKKLHALGVPEAQIRIVSFGKEKPRLLCHEEKCWKENRRVDFVHKLN